VPKNFEGIPEKWLGLYISGLLQYPDADDIFEIVDKNGQKVCLFRFIEDYLGNNRSLSGYVSNAIFFNNDKEISDQLKYLQDFDRKRCKTLSLSCNLDIMDIVANQTRISPVKSTENRPQNEFVGATEAAFSTEVAGVVVAEARPRQWLFKCYHCNNFHTDNEKYYERHNTINHYGLAAYPTIADLEKHGLEPQGKSWEI
jgi:hypothetical protein